MSEENKLKFKKFYETTNDVIFLDGLQGCGKAFSASIIGGMHGVENSRYNNVFEHLSQLHYFNKISYDGCSAIFKIYADKDQYGNLIGRETNFRWSDKSGIFNNPRTFTSIKRIFSNDGDHIMKLINDKNLALLILSHNILLTPQ